VAYVAAAAGAYGTAGAKVGAMTAPDTNRSFTPRAADEQALLDGWLDYYRATVPHKCAGLSPDQLVHRSCPPSTMSLIGLVRHLTEMERVYVHRLTKPDLPLDGPGRMIRCTLMLDMTVRWTHTSQLWAVGAATMGC